MSFSLLVLALLGSFLGSVPAAQADYFHVGNGGEGVLLTSGLYTRDLYDHDLHLQPWVGEKKDPRLERQVQDWNPLGLSSEECDLLARKLTDLNSHQDRLGDDILAAMGYFSWQWTDQSLVLIEPDEVRVPVRPEQRIPIANRFLQSILLHRQNFSRLNSENKIALILHEAVYALMKVERRPHPPSFSQNLSTTRQIVAGLFSKKVLSQEGFSALVEDALAIYREPLENPSSSPLDTSDVLISLTFSNNVTLKLPLRPEMSLDERRKKILQVCRQGIHGDASLTYTVFSTPSPSQLIPRAYQNANGSRQYALSLQYVSKVLRYNHRVYTIGDCLNFIHEVVHLKKI